MEGSIQNIDAVELINSMFAPGFTGEAVLMEQPHNQKILHNGFTFTFDKQSSDGSKNFWRCSKKHGCTARLHTDPTRDNLVIKEMNEHSHEPKRTRVSGQRKVLNGDITKDKEFEELQNQSNEIDQSTDSLSMDASTMIKTEESLSMPKLEPQRKWTNTRKIRIFGDFQAGLLRKEPFETDPYFSRLVNADGQRVAVICNYCNNIYSPQTGGQQAYHKRVCAHIQKVRGGNGAENGDQSDLADSDAYTQSPAPPHNKMFSGYTEGEEQFLEVKHSMSFLSGNSFLQAMIDTAGRAGAQPGGEEDTPGTCSSNDQFSAVEQTPGVAKRARLANVHMDLVSCPKESLPAAPKMAVILKDVEGMPMVAKITPKKLTFADFRRIFLIPKNHPSKRFMFKCESEDESAEFQWLLAMEDDMDLPVLNGQIVAEARTYLV